MPEVRPKLKTIKIQAELDGGFKVITKIRGHTVVQDLSKAIGGEDAGPLPTELLLASLAGCIGVVGRYHAHRFGIDLKGMKIEVEGDLDPRGFLGEDVKPGFHEVRARVVIIGDNSEESAKRFGEFISKHCPIGDVIKSPTKLRIEYVRD